MSKQLHVKTTVDENGLTPGHFRAKWGGVCGVCGYAYEKKEICHYVGKSVAHESCHGVNGSDGFRSPSANYDENGHATVEPSYVVKGKRKTKVCGDCHLQHAGGCDE